MINFFKATVYEPLYNLFVFLIDIIPGGDVGIAVIILTILVKLILFPLSIKAIQSQAKMREIQKPLKEVQEKYKNNREEQARQMMALYKTHKLNPFSGFLNLFIQIPVIISLYYAFVKGLPVIQTELLYPFIKAPEMLNMNFLGLVDISQIHVLWLAVLVAITQYFQAVYAIPKAAPLAAGEKASFQDDLARSMSVQARYVFPVIILFVSYKLIAAVSIYWIVSNLFAIGQELYVRKKYKTPPPTNNGFKEVERIEQPAPQLQ
jgi:YidC/Oxa1 family membrane protein insertase